MVLTTGEVRRLLGEMEGTRQLVARLLYGTGMRLLEGLRLRVKDLDFATGEVTVRAGKGNKHRTMMLRRALSVPLQEHLVRVRELHDRDLTEGHGEVWLPFATTRHARGKHSNPMARRLRPTELFPKS